MQRRTTEIDHVHGSSASGRTDTARAVVAEALGLSDAGDPAARMLDNLVLRAQRLLDADFCAINIFQGDLLVPLVSSLGVPGDVTSRALSVCQHAVGRCPDGAAFLATDLTQDPELRANPWVTGELGSVRFYAAAPLLDRTGSAFGTVCVWSEHRMEPAPDAGRLLCDVRDSVVAVLAAQRGRRSTGHDGPHPRALGPGEAARGTGPSTSGIADIIREGAVQTLFQPIVHLATGSIVGFEALSRGPAGSPLEAPLALLEAAEEAGLLGELDWLCRVLAMERAADADLHPSLSWFINVEPVSLRTNCPEHLLAAFGRARRDLRVVLEIVERDVQGHVTHLLHAADQARADAWGIALDDVGANTASMALLPFLQPDVVKLDMALVRGVPDADAASITADVRAYAERTGATILAEGIETPEQERLARVFGATFGQGYRYGRPSARLPDDLPVPRHVVPLRQTPEVLDGRTPYELLSALLEPQRGRKADVLHMSRHVETLARVTSEPSVVLACFQDQRYFSARDRARYQALAEQHALTVVLAEGLDRAVGPRSHVGPPTVSRMRSEWTVIVLGPREAAAFVARDCGQPGPEPERLFEFMYTFDRKLVAKAARAYLQELHPRPAAPESLHELPPRRAEPLATPPNPAGRPRWRGWRDRAGDPRCPDGTRATLAP